QQESHDAPPAIAICPDSEVEPQNSARENSRSNEPFQLRVVKAKIPANGNSKDTQHQPDVEQQCECNGRQPQYSSTQARRCFFRTQHWRASTLIMRFPFTSSTSKTGI